jgi:hypothetical protein
MKKQIKKYIEYFIYSEKVTTDDNKNFFNNLISTRAPIFGLIDFSQILSLRGIDLLIQCKGNTLKMYVNDRKNLYLQAPLLFPFKLEKPKDVEIFNGRIPTGMQFIKSGNMFDYLVKEKVQEFRIKIIRVLGGFYGFGSMVTKDGRKSMVFILNPSKFFEIDLEKNPAFYIKILDPVPKMMNLTSEYPLFEYDSTKIGVDTFDPFQHGLIVGTSGCGKSRYLEMQIKAIKQKYKDANIVLIDPHDEFAKIFPKAKIVNFKDNYIEPLDTGGDKSPLQVQLIANTITATIGQENKYAERIVFYAVHLLTSIDELTLENLNLLLTDSTKRSEFASMCENAEVKRFFDEEFSDIYMQHFNDAILPIINFIGEYLLYLGGEKKLENLEELLQKNRLNIISFNPHFFGRKIVKFFAGSVINQMYTLAINNKLKKPTILIVDEFPVVQTNVVRNILAEARKFNLYIYTSVQYMGQLDDEVLDSVMGNVRNVIAFKVTREDAKLLSSMMEIKVEEYFKKKMTPSELEEAKHEMFINLHPRQCVVRLFEGKRYLLTMKVQTVDIKRWVNE